VVADEDRRELRIRALGRTGLLSLAVFATAAGLYANSLSGAFVHDDQPIIVADPLVRGRASPAAFFVSSYWQRGEAPSAARRYWGGLYRPLTVLSYALTWRLGGGRPLLFHVVNVVLHGLAAVLLFRLICALGFSVEASFVAAAAFAALPIHAEAVSWSVGRAELLSAVFVLAAWLLLRAESSPGKTALGLFCYAAALLSKESAAAFPAVLILGDMFARRGSARELLDRRLLAWLSVFGVLLGYLSRRRAILGAALSVGAPYFPTQSRLIVVLTMAKFLFRGWLWPTATGLGLCADYSRPGFPDAAPTDPAAWAALAAAVGAAVWAVRAFRSRRSAAGFAVLVFFCLAAPLSNLLVQMEILGAERIMYLPSIGFCLLIAAGWDFWTRRGRAADPRPKAAAAACLLWWSAATVARNRIWRSDAALFASMAASAPDNARALIGLGTAADEAGRHAEARRYYAKVLETEPDLHRALYDMGRSYYEEGDWRSAAVWFRKLDGAAADDDTLCFLGLIAEREGRVREALEYYARVLERDPTDLEARRDLGLLLFKTGRAPESIRQLRLYLDGGPPEADAAEIRRFLKELGAG